MNLKAETFALEIRDLHHAFGATEILHAIDLKVKEGQILGLLGPSGCGKTTLLRCIAGFETITRGTIKMRDKLVTDGATYIAPEKRRVGVVFQDYALFPHLTVSENISFGIRHFSKKDREARVSELLGYVEMREHALKYPKELSGGQQQRVALARALAPSPEILLLDEPFSHLDPSLRDKMKREIKILLRKFSVTTIIVTHDQDEAFDLADEIALMMKGRIEQLAKPETLYDAPETKAVADFVGQSAYLKVDLESNGLLSTALGTLPHEGPLQSKTQVLLRPDDIKLDPSSPHKGEVIDQFFRGTHRILEVELSSGEVIQIKVKPCDSWMTDGKTVGLRLDLKTAPVLF